MPKIFFASATAAKLTDTAPSDSAVSERTRLPTANAEWNSLLSSGPVAPNCEATLNASFTWPSTCGSPMTSESRPEATLKR